MTEAHKIAKETDILERIKSHGHQKKVITRVKIQLLLYFALNMTKYLKQPMQIINVLEQNCHVVGNNKFLKNF